MPEARAVPGPVHQWKPGVAWSAHSYVLTLDVFDKLLSIPCPVRVERTLLSAAFDVGLVVALDVVIVHTFEVCSWRCCFARADRHRNQKPKQGQRKRTGVPAPHGQSIQ